MPKMYATVAYITRNTAWDDIEWHVSRKYDSNSMWNYIKEVERHATRSGTRLLEIQVLTEDGEVVWQSGFGSPVQSVAS